ncbi:MAG: acid protease [Cytophagaceae bacterium]|nr:acid protease [Cytophagaceae bacterium]|tara:strand:- start:4254 stop:4691 length:438 start_codon:yes stop_codon:yes gene_type:complete
MASLRSFLKNKKYTRIKLKETETGHFVFDAKINGVEGKFILDTGASNTCVGFEDIERFKLLAEDSEVKAAGAGALDMLTQISQNNSIEIGKWNYKKSNIVLFDLSHVNTALINHGIPAVSGIIGADVLKKGKAVIDYRYTCFYLK